jgi:hypothetical protein
MKKLLFTLALTLGVLSTYAGRGIKFELVIIEISTGVSQPEPVDIYFELNVIEMNGRPAHPINVTMPGAHGENIIIRSAQVADEHGLVHAIPDQTATYDPATGGYKAYAIIE